MSLYSFLNVNKEKSEKSVVGAFSVIAKFHFSRMFVCSSTVSLCVETGGCMPGSGWADEPSWRGAAQGQAQHH